MYGHYASVVLFALFQICSSRNHKVSVSLQTKWADTSPVLEASEFVQEESLAKFWRFVDLLKPFVTSSVWNGILASEDHSQAWSNPVVYSQVEEIVLRALEENNGIDTSPTLHRHFFRLFQSSRIYSPVVEMEHQVALDSAVQILNCSHHDVYAELEKRISGTAWAHVGDLGVFSLLDLLPALDMFNFTSIETTPSIGKVYNNKIKNEQLPRVVLYADIGQPDFYAWHQHLRELSDAGRCIYILRHYTKNRSSSKIPLSGYGVELALKSTEYKAVDDSQVESKEGGENAATPDNEPVVQGFNFTTLHAVHPNLRSGLDEFHKHLLDTDDEIRPLKPWQFQNLGIQTSIAIMEAHRSGFYPVDAVDGLKVDAGLLALRDLSQNLPSRSARLAMTKINDQVRDEITSGQETLSPMGIRPGQSMILMNGRLLSPQIDIFALLDLLREEYKTMARLHKLGVPSNLITDLLQTSGNKKRISPGGLETSGEPSLPGLKHSVSGKFILDLTNCPVRYLNDLESDLAYSNWPDSLLTLFTPDFTGGIRRLRKNLYNVILVLDPASSDARHIIRLVESFLVNKIAIRFGFLWSIDSSTNMTPSLALIRIFNYISTAVSNHQQSPLPLSMPGLGSPGPMSALAFLTDLYGMKSDLTVELIRKRYEKLFPNAYSEDIFDVPPGDSEYDVQLERHSMFLRLSGLNQMSHEPLLLFNGLIFDWKAINAFGGFENTVVNLCMEELMHVQYAVYQGELSDSDSVFDLYQKHGIVVSRFNPLILSQSAEANYLKFGLEEPDLVENSQQSFTPNILTDFANHMRYFQKGDTESAVRPVTMWVVVGDLDDIYSAPTSPTETDRLSKDFSLASAAITYIRSAQSSKGLRIGFVYNPKPVSDNADTTHLLTRILHLIAHPIHNSTGQKLVESITARNFANRLLRQGITTLDEKSSYPPLSDLLVSGVKLDSLQTVVESLERDVFIQRHSKFCKEILGLNPGERAVIVNGRILGPLGPNDDFVMEDFLLLERSALDSGVVELGETLLKSAGDQLGGPDAVSELTWRVSSVLGPSSDEPSDPSAITDIDSVEGILSKNRIRTEALDSVSSGFNVVVGDQNQAFFDILAIVNPTSREAQRLSHILVVLQQSLPSRTRVLLNPILAHSELPLKTFYRFVWEASPFSVQTPSSPILADSKAVSPHASFTHLPGKPLLTLGMDAPHGWMVAAVEAVHDLDNLRLSDVYTTVEAVFELEYLLLEGHCFENSSMKPPRGLQLTLGPVADLGRFDTIVMANLGYFQLKAGPGAWHLSIRPGRSRDLYSLAGDEQLGVLPGSSELIVNMNSFRAKIITVRVAKNPERDSESLLDESTTATQKSPQDTWSWLYKNSDVWSTISNYAETLCPTWLTSLRKALKDHLPWQKCSKSETTINVFSLASGHLYERLLRIMMLTVIRHTKSPVKFWFLKNYLSPTFKDFIPHMAAEYGFEYELVQYQWPRWLHAQTEKQRIIWGYKILFLDVLFPLNVTKIIFVDADQIVRADLQELADLDLYGAPYGYTPFCESRTEMDGFRFWKQGYWASHLSGRPYHISALYVVDLTRFRQLAAGDRLRGQYHGLSQDPNSLSNLDQDLPNNMIHQVPIRSLPQEWLWCETWCSDESKEKAKTIDLCNNPQTKEPKLSAAMRIAPEWVGYDQEIKKLWKRIYPPARSSKSIVSPGTPASPVTKTPTASTATDDGQCDAGCPVTRPTTSIPFAPSTPSTAAPTSDRKKSSTVKQEL